MRNRVLIAACVVVAACSKPSPTPDKQAAAEARRDLSMPTSGPEVQVVSDVESAVRLKPPVAHGVLPSAVATTPARKKPTAEPAAVAQQDAEPMAGAGVAPRLSSTLNTPARFGTQRLAMAPVAALPDIVPGPRSNGHAYGFLPGLISSGPVVIIRGGRGGPDDDCDLGRGRVGRPGAAVNSLLPPIPSPDGNHESHR